MKKTNLQAHYWPVKPTVAALRVHLKFKSRIKSIMRWICSAAVCKHSVYSVSQPRPPAALPALAPTAHKDVHLTYPTNITVLFILMTFDSDMESVESDMKLCSVHW